MAARLTPKQQRFVEEYLLDLNGTAAYRRAGYAARTDNAAAVGAAELLRNPKVAAAIAAAQAARSERTKISADRVIRELARVAFLDPRKVMNWGPAGVVINRAGDLDEDTAACVAEASQTVTESGGSIRIKLCSKIQALSLLGQHLGLFKQKLEVVGAPVVVEDERWYGNAAHDPDPEGAAPPGPGPG